MCCSFSGKLKKQKIENKKNSIIQIIRKIKWKILQGDEKKIRFKKRFFSVNCYSGVDIGIRYPELEVSGIGIAAE